ncbi:hypothetical protein DVH05_019630 [Phytophthora capsici]|nr:hypothetical protein DVH05_019630 [Phytophthora capsici]
MPPVAREERAHRPVFTENCAANEVYSSPQNGLGIPPPVEATGNPLKSMRPPISGLSTHSTQLTVEDMIAVLKHRLDDAMELIELQQRVIRDTKLPTMVYGTPDQQTEQTRLTITDEE